MARRIKDIIKFVTKQKINEAIKSNQDEFQGVIKCERRSIYPKINPQSYNPWNYLFKLLEDYLDVVKNISEGKKILCEIIKILYNEKEITKTDGEKKIERTVCLNSPEMEYFRKMNANLYIIKTKNVFSTSDIDVEDMCNKINQHINGSKNEEIEVDIQSMGKLEHNIELSMNVNDRKDYYVYLIIIEKNNKILSVSEPYTSIGEKQFIQRCNEEIYMNVLLKKGRLERCLYYIRSMMKNVEMFKNEIEYGIKFKDLNVSFEEEKLIINKLTDNKSKKRNLKLLSKLLSNNNEDPIPFSDYQDVPIKEGINEISVGDDLNEMLNNFLEELNIEPTKNEISNDMEQTMNDIINEMEPIKNEISYDMEPLNNEIINDMNIQSPVVSLNGDNDPIYNQSLDNVNCFDNDIKIDNTLENSPVLDFISSEVTKYNDSNTPLNQGIEFNLINDNGYGCDPLMYCMNLDILQNYLLNNSYLINNNYLNNYPYEQYGNLLDGNEFNSISTYPNVLMNTLGSNNILDSLINMEQFGNIESELNQGYPLYQ